MSVIKNINSANVCTLENKGADRLCAALDSLTKKGEKNIANYLVVPNNFVLSLSLSHRPGLTSPLFSFRIRARGVLCNPCKQRTFQSFLCSLFCVPM